MNIAQDKKNDLLAKYMATEGFKLVPITVFQSVFVG